MDENRLSSKKKGSFSLSVFFSLVSFYVLFMISFYAPTFTLKNGQERGQRNYNFVVRNILIYGKNALKTRKRLKHKDNPFSKK